MPFMTFIIIFKVLHDIYKLVFLCFEGFKFYFRFISDSMWIIMGLLDSFNKEENVKNNQYFSRYRLNLIDSDPVK